LCPPEPRDRRLGVDYYAHAYPVTSLIVVPDGETTNDLVRQFANRVFRHQPLDFLRAWGEDFVKGFRWDRVDARADVVVSRWQFQKTWPFPEFDPRAQTDEFGGGSPRVVGWAATTLRGYQLSVGYAPGPLLALALLVGLAGALGLGRARASGRRAACWLATLSAVGVVLVADVYEFSWRYQLPMLVLAPIAGAVGAAALWPPRAAQAQDAQVPTMSSRWPAIENPSERETASSARSSVVSSPGGSSTSVIAPHDEQTR
jgi:hypothetical protein